jgi:hypothetical protein
MKWLAFALFANLAIFYGAVGWSVLYTLTLRPKRRRRR